MLVAELLALLARGEGFERGGYLEVVDDDTLDYVGPEGLLTPEIRREITEKKKAIVAWLRTPLDALPREDLLLFDYDPVSPARQRLWDDFLRRDRESRPARAIEQLVTEFERLGVRFLMYSEGGREQLGYVETPGTSIDKVPEALLREALAREQEIEQYARGRGWRWDESAAPGGAGRPESSEGSGRTELPERSSSSATTPVVGANPAKAVGTAEARASHEPEGNAPPKRSEPTS